MKSVWISLGAFVAASVGTDCLAASVQFDVRDEAGNPLSDAVVFLESPEEAKAVKPLQGA